MPEATAWINSFSDDPTGWAFHAGDTPLWSFQLSRAAGERVRARLQAGEALHGRALVRSELKAGTLPVITGVVPGAGTEEVVLVGHQFEVGAIDNASGVAAMLEALRAIQSLIHRGALPQPQRSIRLLAVSECYTNLYWWETTRRHRRTVAGLCLDSPVGSPDYAVRPMDLHLNPHAQSSYTDALLVHLVDQVMAASPMYAWREAAYAMTDNLIADTSIGIPCPWIGGHSRTWHTSADTADKLPVRELGLSAQITAAYAYLIASAGPALALDFAHLAAMRGKQVLAAAGVAEQAAGEERAGSTTACSSSTTSPRGRPTRWSRCCTWFREASAPASAPGSGRFSASCGGWAKRRPPPSRGAPDSPATLPPRCPPTRRWRGFVRAGRCSGPSASTARRRRCALATRVRAGRARCSRCCAGATANAASRRPYASPRESCARTARSAPTSSPRAWTPVYRRSWSTSSSCGSTAT